ncbi:MAG: hypothetical protein HZA70_05630 [Planctomycetes bacterium]|nr:hypothetical protein [Planctomycetota bacterium]
MEERDELERHKTLRELYWSNAQEAVRKKEYEKVGEFVWGSLTQLFHGLALVKGVPLQTHAKLKNFANEIARDLRSEGVRKAFEEGEKLHANFYRSFLDPAQIATSTEVVRRGMEELLKRAETRL